MRRLGTLALLLLAAFPGRLAAQTIYWTDTKYGTPTLHRSDVNGEAQLSVALPAGTLPEGIAFNPAGAHVYWVEGTWTGARVRKTAQGLGSHATLVTGGSCFRGVALDPVGGKVYWTSSNLVTGGSIHRANLDGSSPQVVLNLGPAANPRGIAVDPAGGRIYWADFDQNLIRRANLDGSAATTLYTLAATAGPWGLALNAAAGQLYWCEYGQGNVRRAPAAGGVQTTLAFNRPNPTYLALDPTGNRLFWVEAAGSPGPSIQRSALDGTGRVTLPVPMTSYGGIAFAPAGIVAAEAPAPPAEFALEGVAPNPSRGAFRVAYALPTAATVRLGIVDVNGRHVATLRDGVQEAGRHEATWDGRVGERAAAAGVYFVRLEASGRSWNRRMTLVR